MRTAKTLDFGVVMPPSVIVYLDYILLAWHCRLCDVDGPNLVLYVSTISYCCLHSVLFKSGSKNPTTFLYPHGPNLKNLSLFLFTQLICREIKDVIVSVISKTDPLTGPTWPKEWAARPDLILLPWKPRYPLYRGLDRPHVWPTREENLVPNRIRSRTIQPVVSR